MPSLSPDVSILGQARNVTTSTTSQRNSTVLAAGRYVAIVNGGIVHFRQGSSSVTATTNDLRMEDNSVVYFTVPATGATFSYMALIAAAGTPAVYVAGVDEQTAASQPSAWA